MAELDEKLNALLSDPGSMAQIVQMAQQLSATMGGDAGVYPGRRRYIHPRQHGGCAAAAAYRSASASPAARHAGGRTV